MNESELSRQLSAAVSGIDVSADLAEVEAGAGRVRSRRRLVTGVAAAMLVAGAGGVGFGLGRAASDDAPAMLAESADGLPAAASSGSDEGAQADAEEPLPPADDAAPVAADPVETSAANEPGGTSAREESAASAVGRDAAYGWGQPLELVYDRQLGDIRVRVQVGEPWQQEPWTENGWTPAKFCWATTESRITIDGPDVVDVSGVGWYEALYNGLQVSTIDLGWSDGRPMRVLQIQAAPDMTAVSVRWDDGAADAVEVVDGVAILLVDGGDAWSHDYTLEITDGDGVRTLSKSDVENRSDAEYREACNPPPPSLPEAGDQPADVEAAEAALLERWNLLWDRLATDKPDGLIDDRTGVDEAIEQVFSGGLVASAESAVHVMEEMVFTSPTEAWYRYGIDTINGYFGERYGTATLTDAGWVFPRAVVCNDLALGGGSCDPGFEAIYPPSWYEQYGSQCFIDEQTGDEVCAVPTPIGD